MIPPELGYVQYSMTQIAEQLGGRPLEIKLRLLHSRDPAMYQKSKSCLVEQDFQVMEARLSSSVLRGPLGQSRYHKS